MALPYLLPSPHGHHYYETAQLAAFAVYVALLLGQGYRRGYPARAWLPLVTASTLALVLGCQLVFLSPTQWLDWLRGDAAAGQVLAGGPRSIVGGATASFLAVVLLKRALGFKGWAVLDAFAGPLCWALAVQCVGCTLAGCCWGQPTAGSWGVAYGPGTPAYLTQVALGLVPAGAAHTLPLVPTQLFQLLLCAGVGVALHLVRRRATAWPGGSRYLLALGLLCLGRFVVEGWRDPASEPLLASPVALGPLVLPGLQWLLLLEAVAQLGLWAWLVRRPAAAEIAPAPPPLASALVGLGLLAATTRLAPGALALAEVATLQALLLLVLLAQGHTWLTTLGRGVPRLAGLPLSLLLAGALLLATAQAPAPQRAAGKSITLSGGVLGNYHEASEDILDGHVCSGSQPLYLQQRVRAVGGEVALNQTNGSTSSTIGGGLWIGQQQIKATVLPSRYGPYPLTQDTTLRYTLADAHVYAEGRGGSGWLTASGRLGLHVGSLGYYSYFDSGNAQGTAFLMPELMLSLGNPRIAYAQADFCYGAENALGACTSRLAVGSGLGQLNNSQLLVGYAHSAHYPTRNLAFASATLRLPASTGLSLEPYFATDFDQHNLFSLKLHYRLGRQ